MVRTWRVAHSLDALLREVNEHWPGRPKHLDGSIGDTSHSTRTSDHNPWCPLPHGGVVTARDFTEWVVDGVEMNDVLAEHLRERRDPRIKYVISDGRMFSSYPTSTHKAWTWRPYTGVNAHRQHVHVSVQPTPALFDSTAPWGLLDRPDPSPEEDAVLKRGSKGRAVEVFQRALMVEAQLSGRNGGVALPKYGVDGDFGAEMEAAVLAYQAGAQLPQTGVLDGITAALLIRYQGVSS